MTKTTDTARLVAALEALVAAFESGDNDALADASWEADGATLDTPFDDANADPRWATIYDLTLRANDENGTIEQAQAALDLARTM